MQRYKSIFDPEVLHECVAGDCPCNGCDVFGPQDYYPTLHEASEESCDSKNLKYSARHNKCYSCDKGQIFDGKKCVRMSSN